MAAAERAFQLSDHATERERLFIRGTYFQLHGRPNEASAEYEALVRLYPDHYWAVNNLARSYLGRDEALPYWLRLAELRPNGALQNLSAAQALIFMGRADEAVPYVERARAIQKALRVKPDEWIRLGVGPDEWAKCFPIWRRWVRGDVAGAMTALRELSALADEEGEELRKYLADADADADLLMLRQLGR